MAAPVDLSLSLVSRARPSPAEDLAQRVRLVLETQPGRVPWEPTFGCDLEGLVGNTAAQTRIAEARMRITGALRRFLPDASMVSCKVELVERSAPGSASDPSVPLAERALASPGLTATLEVRIVVETDDGPVALEAQLTP
jgi:phage baseplate assembly protein W